jgi:hypothetical protein
MPSAWFQLIILNDITKISTTYGFTSPILTQSPRINWATTGNHQCIIIAEKNTAHCITLRSFQEDLALIEHYRVILRREIIAPLYCIIPHLASGRFQYPRPLHSDWNCFWAGSWSTQLQQMPYTNATTRRSTAFLYPSSLSLNDLTRRRHLPAAYWLSRNRMDASKRHSTFDRTRITFTRWLAYRRVDQG